MNIEHKLFAPLSISWSTKTEICLRAAALGTLIGTLLFGFLGGFGIQLSLNYSNLTYGVITKSTFDFQNIVAGWIGLAMMTVVIAIPFCLMVFGRRAQTLKYTIVFNYIYSVVILAITLAIGIYSLINVSADTNVYSVVFIVGNILLLIGFCVASFYLYREINKQWKIRTVVDYNNFQNKFKVYNTKQSPINDVITEGEGYE